MILKFCLDVFTVFFFYYLLYFCDEIAENENTQVTDSGDDDDEYMDAVDQDFRRKKSLSVTFTSTVLQTLFEDETTLYLRSPTTEDENSSFSSSISVKLRETGGSVGISTDDKNLVNRINRLIL